MLASQSPRRRELLEQAGFFVECVPAGVDEMTDGEPQTLAIANAEAKARAVACGRPDAIVIGADTIVVLDGEIFGKPGSLDHAREMLARLAGRTHEVMTGVVMLRQSPETCVRFCEVTRVRFHALDAGAIDRYLADIHVLDKAGAYSAQEDDGRIIANVEGSFSNVIGLPMERLVAELAANFGG